MNKIASTPTSLAGFQLLCSSTIREGDLFVGAGGDPLCWVSACIGETTNDNGEVPGREHARVYRRIPVPHPGGLDVAPSTGRPHTVSAPAVHHSHPAPRASETGPDYRIPLTPEQLIARTDPFVSGGIAATVESAQEFAAACAPRTGLPTTAIERKGIPIATGCIDYFPDALAAVARLSKVGNDQHNPGKPLHWDKSKSTDEADALMRHFLDRGTVDTDGVRHSAKVAWRALALLQREIETECAGGVR